MAAWYQEGSAVADRLVPEAAPSHELRKWFNHDPAKWKEFQRRYRTELEVKPAAWQPLLETAKAGKEFTGVR